MKDYKKILEGVVNIINTTEKSDIGFANICTYIGENCPELAESEDERIRKALISAINNICAGDEGLVTFNGFSKEQVLAWLEKQCKHANFRNKIQIGDKVTRNDNGELVNLSQLERVAKKLEKQEEQKPVEEYNITGIGSKNAQGKLGEMIKNLKPANKVEPKFHEGDWTVSKLDKEARQISEVHFDEYNSYYVVNGKCVNLEEYDRLHHLWTIQDAKDGDVLASDNSIFIFQEEYIAEKPIAYCGLMNELFIKGEDACWTNERCYPATKEQRDALIKATADAGYTFDFEKKELKKIKKDSAWSEEDNRLINEVIELIDAGSLDREEKDDYIERLKSLKDRVGCEVNCTTIKVWSEEDEAHFDSILKRLEGMCKPRATYTATRCSISEDKDWLKSLKKSL